MRLSAGCVSFSATPHGRSTPRTSIIWLADRAEWAVDDPAHLPKKLKSVHDAARENLRKVLENGGRLEGLDKETGEELCEASTELEKLEGLPWSSLLRLELIRRTRGFIRENGGRSGGVNSPRFKTVADQQEGTFGERLIEEVVISGSSPESVGEWIDALVEIRHEIVHRATTPGYLDTAGVREWVPRTRRIGRALDQQILRWADQNLVARHAAPTT